MSKRRHHQQRTPSRQSTKPTLTQLRKKVQKQPMDPAGWKALGEYYASQKEWHSAQEPLERALELAPQDPAVLELMGRTENGMGNDSRAVTLLEQAIALAPGDPQILFSMARVLHDRTQDKEALEYTERALAVAPKNLVILAHKGNVLYRLHRYNEAIEVFKSLTQQQPDKYSHWNNAGNLLRDLGKLDEAVIQYQKADKLAGANAIPFSNHLTALHYHPHATPEEIFALSREWEKRFAPRDIPERPVPHDTALNKRLRIGMISDGFRSHPVGKMITSTLERLAAHEFELFAYSTNNAVDPLTVRIRNVTTQWKAIPHLSDEALAQQIRDDQIDILIDLAGHNTGSRMRVMAMQPAPLLVKWVGGLINTTGLSSIDYLISDAIETPQGCDDSYTEKLIRLPNDYICYEPPARVPPVSALPAKSNGYITLGCFNNAAKVNPVVLGEWAKIMHQLPDSRLFLKSFQYNSVDLCDRVRGLMAEHGIEAERLIIEGASPHFELLEAYHRVDIALDPWPYSGGLTTCEAFMMGVPVVTLPGPTFAGRHSATHLVNAGMPELVTHSWEEYRQRVIGLAGDLESLGTIRTHLHDILLQSPVCDAPRFAEHFTTAMRAIWQRYCDGKQPAALTLDKAGQAQFEGEDQPVEISHPEPLPEDESGFKWQFTGKIVTLDNGALLTSSSGATKLLGLGAFGMIAFDPASKITQPETLQAAGELHHYPHAVLGDGNPATLYACLDPEMSATLRPLPTVPTLTGEEPGPQVLAQLPINTIQLDKIEGLEAIDWLILDNMNDSLAVLENGEKALADTLLIQARVNFQPTHENQPELTLISHWAARHGFRFYRLNNAAHLSHLPERDDLLERQATQLASADAIYIPNAERMAALDDNQRMKLAFVLHTVYGMKDTAYSVLKSAGIGTEENYWQSISVSKENGGDNNYFSPQKNISASVVSASPEVKKAAESLNEALGDRELIFLGTGDMANHGIVQKGQARLMQQMKDLGINVSWANGQNPVPIEKILQLASSGKAAFYGSNRYYDADVSISGIDKKNLFDALGVPIIGFIGDHPYTNFMMNRIANASRNGLLYGTQSLVDEVKFLRPDIKYVSAWASEPAPTLIMEEPVDHSKRDIDILVPMNLDYACEAENHYSSLLIEAKRVSVNHYKLVSKVVEEYVDFSKSLMRFYKECYRDIFCSEWQPCTPWSQHDIVLIKLLGKIDDIVRGRKRLEAMSLIAKAPSDYNIVVLANENVRSRLPKNIGNANNLKFVGAKSAADLEGLYKKSRYVLNVSPTYHDSIHERVRNAAAAGCAIVSNRNKKLSESFTDKKNILFYEESGVASIVSKDKKYSEKIGLSARQVVVDIYKDTQISSILNIYKNYLSGSFCKS